MIRRTTNKKTAKLKGLQWGLPLAVMAMMTAFAPAAEATYTLPAARSVKWQGNVGSTATIPSAGAVVDCTKAPYNVPTNGTTDAAPAIKACLSAIPSGSVAYLPAGTYSVRSSIYVPSNKTLRGAGKGKTIIKGATTWGGWGVVGINPNGAQKLSASVNVSGSLTKGSTTVTTATAHNLAVGDYVVIDQLDNPGGDPPVTNKGDGGTCTWCGRMSGRSLGQIDRVASVTSPTSFTVEIPLYWSYASSLNPQVTKQNGMTVNAGVESLTIDNSVVKDQHAGLLYYAANCWFYDVDIKYTAREGISLIGYRNTIRNTSIHDTAVPLGPNSGYGLWMQVYASANLIENNHFYRTSNPIIINGQTSGNVIAYNWLEGDDQNTGRQNGAFSSHGAHPMMNLVEGNVMSGEMALDFYWGSASHYTFFRNRLMMQSPFSTYSQHKFLADLRQKNWYVNMVGNVLWNSGQPGSYELSSGTISISSPGGAYVLGYNTANAEVDGTVKATLLRHGNYDYVLNTTTWNGSDDRALPASLYLTSKPAFLGSAPWPVIGPDVSPMAPLSMPWPAGTSTAKTPSAPKLSPPA